MASNVGGRPGQGTHICILANSICTQGPGLLHGCASGIQLHGSPAHLVLSPAPGADPDLRSLAAELSSITAQELGLDARQIVLRGGAESSQWFVGGRSLAADGRTLPTARAAPNPAALAAPKP